MCASSSATRPDRSLARVSSSLLRGLRLESGARRGHRGADSGRAARRDAGRAHAFPPGNRPHRHARQDDHHEPGRLRPSRRRARPDIRDRRAAEERGQQREARHEPLSRRGSGRERRLLSAPAAGHRDRDECRQRPPVTHGGDFERLQAELRRVPAQPPVLRARRPLQRRRGRARTPAAGQPPDGPLRARRGCGLACRVARARGRQDALPGDPCGAPAACRRAQPARAAQRPECPCGDRGRNRARGRGRRHPVRAVRLPRGSAGGSSSSARLRRAPAGSRSSTTTAITRRRSRRP